MKTLTEEIENVKDSDLEQISEKFPRGGAIAILKNHPELLSDCKLTYSLSATAAATQIGVLSQHSRLVTS
jgi:hypothetical protein